MISRRMLYGAILPSFAIAVVCGYASVTMAELAFVRDLPAMRWPLAIAGFVLGCWVLGEAIKSRRYGRMILGAALALAPVLQEAFFRPSQLPQDTARVFFWLFVALAVLAIPGALGRAWLEGQREQWEQEDERGEPRRAWR